MSTNALHEYRTALNGASLSAQAKTNMKHAVRARALSSSAIATPSFSAVDGARSASSAHALQAARPARSRSRRVLAIAACTLAVSVGLVVAGNAGVLPTLGLNSIFSPAGTSVHNDFVLKAYADGSPVAGSVDTVLPLKSFINPANSSWDVTDGGTIHTSWDLDLALACDNVKSVTVSLPEDSGIRLEYSRMKTTGENQGGQSGTSLDLSMDELSDPDFSSYVQLAFSVKPQGDLAAAYTVIDQYYHGNKSFDDAAYAADSRAFTEALDAQTAEMLAAAPVTITATLADGSTTTHTYRFTAAGDFTKQNREWREKILAAPLQMQRDKLAKDGPSLFAITQES